jgi:carbon-monoxide dehydrogenase large subunit
MSGKLFGAKVKRLEDESLLTGKARFSDDIRRPNALYAVFLRSPHGHAKILKIDASAARTMPGVVAIYVAADFPEKIMAQRFPLMLPNATLLSPRTQYPLAVDEVCYVGDPVAVVLAESRYQAEDALPFIEVDYEVLPAVADALKAAEPGSPLAHSDLKENILATFTQNYGDVDDAFAKAPHVFSESLWQHRGGGNAMETRGVTAEFDRDTDRLTVWSSTQTPHIARRMLAEIFKRDVENVRVIAPDVGGGFGPKNIFYPEEAAVAAASMLIDRPVKFIEDRREHFMCATQEHDQYWDMEIACDDDGRILGVRGSLLHDQGAFVPWGIIMPYISSTTLPGPYVLPAYRLDVKVVLTNKVGAAPVRGAGRPQAVFAMERLLDRVARELKLDRAEVRQRNFIQPSQMPYAVGLTFRDGKPLTYDSGDFPKGQNAAVAAADWAGFPARKAAARAQGRHIGIGIANYVEGTGLGPFEGITIRVHQDGKVHVATGATSQGQGTRTALAQIVADNLGCRIEDIVMKLGDTAAIAQGMGAFASRQTVNAGNSAVMAARSVHSQIRSAAALALGVDADDIEIEDSVAFSKLGNKSSLSFAEVARASQGLPGFAVQSGQSVGIENTAYFLPSQATYCSGTHICEVEIDTGTGGVKILNYTIAHDCGTIVNPLIVDGQVQGGLAHGIGNALLEWMKYDENAQPVTITLADYLLPMATDVPDARIEHVVTPTPNNPLGVKGAGEGGTIPAAAAIVSAVEDALSDYHVRFAKTPLMPETIIEALVSDKSYIWRDAF